MFVSDPFAHAIARLTCHVIAYRFELENERHHKMPLELKGLRDKAVLARANLDKLHEAYDKFNVDAPQHAADVESLASQIGDMQDDLKFATTTLGNSGGASGKQPEKPKDPPVVTDNSEQPKAAAIALAPAQEVAETASTTFRAAE